MVGTSLGMSASPYDKVSTKLQRMRCHNVNCNKFVLLCSNRGACTDIRAATQGYSRVGGTQTGHAQLWLDSTKNTQKMVLMCADTHAHTAVNLGPR
jgi:hypothetical protein